MGIWSSCALLPLRHEKTKDIQRGPSLLRETVKSIFWIDESVAGSNGPSGRRRECAVQAFSPQVKTLAQGRLCRSEHSNPEGAVKIDVLKYQKGIGETTPPAFWPAAPLRRTSVLPQAKPRRRRNSLPPSISNSPGYHKNNHTRQVWLFLWSG